MKKFKIVIVGGGSTWTPGLLKSLSVKQKDFPLSELRLYDIDGERQERIGKFAQILFNEEYQGVKVTYTTDKEVAYKDVDFVFCQIRSGGFKMRSFDEKIPFAYGVIGQETCGPGGFAYGMRSIPDLIQIVLDARTYGNDPFILNYTNPAAIVAVALEKRFPNDKKIINMCDQPVNLLKSYGRLLKRDYNEFQPEYFGLNHFGWFTHIYDNEGVDLVPQIRQQILTNGFIPADAEERDKSWLDTYGMVQTILKCFPDYIPNTYLQYYLFPEYKVGHLNPEYTRVDEVINGREKRVFEECDKIIARNAVNGSVIARNEAHADMIVDVATSIAFNQNKVFILITQNNGVISNINSDAMVECACSVGANGVKAFAVGEIDTFAKGLIEGQYAYEKLTVEAFFEKSYEKALKALTLNRTVVDGLKAKALLDDLIDANKDYFPELS